MAAFWLNSLIFLTINVLTVTSNSEFCASVFKAQVDHFLFGHVMNESTFTDEFECHRKCLRNNSCKSFNIRPGADIAKRLCELNNKTRKMTPESFKKMKGSSYYGPVKVSCQDLPTNKKKQAQPDYKQPHPDYKGKRSEIPRPGWNSTDPAYSCKSIRDSGDSKGDGRYWIDPKNSGNPLNVYCDMTTDGGGWLLVSNVVIGSTPPCQLPVKTSYRGITGDQMVLTKTAMNELRTNLSFTQLRFHCSKNNGSTFHVTTAANSTGEAVVQYFSGQTNVQPASCGSFVRMENDNPSLARVCQNRGRENKVYKVGKWGHGQNQDRLYIYPAFTFDKYHWYMNLPNFSCDDHDGTPLPTSSCDFWKVYKKVKTAINELRTHLSFTQLRFHCSKKNGRTFHVTTAANITGEAVVQYFSGQTDVQPASCGSYFRMENDNSRLAGVCQKWGRGASWGVGFDQERLYSHPAWVYGLYLWALDHPSGGQAKRWECDDYLVGVTTGDFWKIYVR
ncbi:uncharacterized protein [Porites lutea]|uniref:uncharacterized protein n=1 Tax=Porites lutea TaxID=51062 RepID=UPI003CC5E8A3